jgi:hypothetical protein
MGKKNTTKKIRNKIKRGNLTSRGVELVMEPVVNVESRKAEHPKITSVKRVKKLKSKR